MRIPTIAALLTASLISFEQVASAVPIPTISGRWYAKGRVLRTTQRDITAVKAVMNGGTSALSPGAPTITELYGTKMNKDLWVYFNDLTERDCYVEAMASSSRSTAGQAANGIAIGYPTSIAPTYKGYELGVTGSDQSGNLQVTSYAYGTNNSAAAAAGGTIEIKKASTGGWEIWINNVRALQVPLRCATAANQAYIPVNASAADAGIESNDTTNTFTSGTTADVSLKTVFGGSNYAPWLNPTLTTPNSGPNWATTYNATTGRLTFTR
jgi:hypothetical protein